MSRDVRLIVWCSCGEVLASSTTTTTTTFHTEIHRRLGELSSHRYVTRDEYAYLFPWRDPDTIRAGRPRISLGGNAVKDAER